MENPIEPTEDQWSSNSFLYKIWRQRESQLLKLLTVRNLAETRRAFDKEHLSLSRYMEIMIALLANWTINRDELVIQLLDMFCCIDVNGDNSLQWDELLEYVVITGKKSLSRSADGSGVVFEYSYRPFEAGALTARAAAAAAAAASAASVTAPGEGAPIVDTFEVFTHARLYPLPAPDSADNNDSPPGPQFCVVAFRRGAKTAHMLQWGIDASAPVLKPLQKYQHESSLSSHRVLAAEFVPSLGRLVTCSEAGVGGPASLNFFDSASGALLARVALSSPCALLSFVPSEGNVYAASDAGEVYVVEPPQSAAVAGGGGGDGGTHAYLFGTCTAPSLPLVSAPRPQGPSRWTAATAVPALSRGLLAVGYVDGHVALWDPRSCREVRGCRALAHHFGVGALCYSDAAGALLSVGAPHPERAQGLPDTVYGVLVWALRPWLDHCRAVLEAEMGPGGHGAAAAAEGARVAQMRPRVLVGHRAPVTAISVSPELVGGPPQALSLDEGGEMRVWNVVTGVCEQVLQLSGGAPTRFIPASKQQRRGGGGVGGGDGGGGGSSVLSEGGAGDAAAARYAVRLAALASAKLMGLEGVEGEAGDAAIRALRELGMLPELHAPPPASAGPSLELSGSILLGTSVDGGGASALLGGGAEGFATSPPGACKGLSPSTSSQLAALGLLEGLTPRRQRVMVAKVADGEVAGPFPTTSAQKDFLAASRSVTAVLQGETKRSAAAVVKRAARAVKEVMEREGGARLPLSRDASQVLAVIAEFRAGGGTDARIGATAQLSLASSPSLGAALPVEAHKGAAVAAPLKGAPSILLVCPRALGGGEQWRLALVGGEGSHAPIGATGNVALLARHGLRIFALTPKLPVSEPVFFTAFLAPTLEVVTATTSALVVWDALCGRPRQVLSAEELGGGDISSVAVNTMQRKAVVGDAAGRTVVVNLATGIVIKELDPRASEHAPPGHPHASAVASIGLQLYTGRGEVVSVAADGTVWTLEERSLEGYVEGTAASTLTRVYALPFEVPRAPGPLLGASLLSGGGGGSGGGENDALAITSPGLGAMSVDASLSQSLLSAFSLPAAAEGAATLRAVAPLSPTSFPSAAPALAPPPPVGAPHPSPVPSGDSERPKITVTAVAVSVRLNLLALSCRVLAPTTRNGAGGVQGSEEEMDTSFALLLFNYESGVLMGACARAPYDPLGLRERVASGFSGGGGGGTTRRGGAATAGGNAAGTPTPGGGRPSFSAGDMSAVAGPLQRSARHEWGGALLPDASPSADSSSEAVDDEEGTHDAMPDEADPHLAHVDARAMGYALLPAATALHFLDPLGALLSAHADGGIRLWSVFPCAAPPCSLRALWFLPEDVTAAAAAGQEAALRAVTAPSSGGGGGGGSGGGSGSGARTPGRPPGGSGRTPGSATPAGGSGRPALAVERDPPPPLQRRYAVAVASRAATVAPPMLLGTLFPHGHCAYLPAGAPAPPPAPAPGFTCLAQGTGLEAEESRTLGGPAPPRRAGSGLHGDLGNVLYATPVGLGAPPADAAVDAARAERPLAEPLYLHAPNVAAGEDGVVVWLGDAAGEIHRYFLSSAALAAAGVQPARKPFADEARGGTEDAAKVLPKRTTARALGIALGWSRNRSRLFASAQNAAARVALAAAAAARSGEPPPLPPPGAPAGAAAGAHPALAHFFGQHKRQPFWPAVGEALPPPYVLLGGAPPAYGPVGGPSGEDVGGAVTLAGPPGVVWEGSWRAHVACEITSIAIIADSGAQALLTGGSDGFARAWDHNGRLLGTLDTSPRFMAPRLEYAKEGLQSRHGAAAAPGLSLTEMRDPFTLAALPPLAAEAPPVYGPGRGSGAAFDAWSMMHVATHRLYDGRLVSIPAGAMIREPLVPPAPARTDTSSIRERMQAVNDPLSEGGGTGAVVTGEKKKGGKGKAPDAPPPQSKAAAALLASMEKELLAIAADLEQPLTPELTAVLPAGWRPDAVVELNRPYLRTPVLFPTTVAVQYAPQSQAAGRAALAAATSAISVAAAAAPPPPPPAGGKKSGKEEPPPPTRSVLSVLTATGASPGGYAPQGVPAAVRSGSGARAAPCASGAYFSGTAPPQGRTHWHLRFDLASRRARQLQCVQQVKSMLVMARLQKAAVWVRTHAKERRKEELARSAAAELLRLVHDNDEDSDGNEGLPEASTAMEGGNIADATAAAGGGDELSDAPPPNPNTAAARIARLAMILRRAVDKQSQRTELASPASPGAAASVSELRRLLSIGEAGDISDPLRWEHHPFKGVLSGDVVACTLQQLVEEDEAEAESAALFGMVARGKDDDAMLPSLGPAAKLLRKEREEKNNVARRVLGEERAARAALRAEALQKKMAGLMAGEFERTVAEVEEDERALLEAEAVWEAAIRNGNPVRGAPPAIAEAKGGGRDGESRGGGGGGEGGASCAAGTPVPAAAASLFPAPAKQPSQRPGIPVSAVAGSKNALAAVSGAAARACGPLSQLVDRALLKRAVESGSQAAAPTSPAPAASPPAGTVGRLNLAAAKGRK